MGGTKASFIELMDVRRSEWDPNDNTPSATRTFESIVGFELHHTGAAGPANLSTDTKADWLLSIERYHELTKKWSDIFYNVFVFADGEIWEARRADRSSTPAADSKLVVHIPGNSPVITAAQHASLLKLARWCTDNPDNVSGHSDRASTACPGSSGRAELELIRDQLKETIMTLQDLGNHPEAQAAQALGLWDGSDPAGAASRSVVAVVAYRAHVEALTAITGTLDKIMERLDKLESDALHFESVAGPAGPRGPRGFAGDTGPAGISGLADIIERLTI